MLISYHYFKQPIEPMMTKWFPGEWPEIFADSGAYSALSQGVDIDIDVYAEWLKANRHLFFVYANLDVIGDGAIAAEATWANQRILEDHGLAPLPVFHAGEPLDALERLLAEIAAIHQKQDASRAGIFHQAINEIHRRERLARTGGHLDERAEQAFCKRFLQAGDGFDLRKP